MASGSASITYDKFNLTELYTTTLINEFYDSLRPRILRKDNTQTDRTLKDLIGENGINEVVMKLISASSAVRNVDPSNSVEFTINRHDPVTTVPSTLKPGASASSPPVVKASETVKTLVYKVHLSVGDIINALSTAANKCNVQNCSLRGLVKSLAKQPDMVAAIKELAQATSISRSEEEAIVLVETSKFMKVSPLYKKLKHGIKDPHTKIVYFADYLDTVDHGVPSDVDVAVKGHMSRARVR